MSRYDKGVCFFDSCYYSPCSGNTLAIVHDGHVSYDDSSNHVGLLFNPDGIIVGYANWWNGLWHPDGCMDGLLLSQYERGNHHGDEVGGCRLFGDAEAWQEMFHSYGSGECEEVSVNEKSSFMDTVSVWVGMEDLNIESCRTLVARSNVSGIVSEFDWIIEKYNGQYF